MANYNTYSGGYSSLDPTKDAYFTGYSAPAGNIGGVVNAMSANQLAELNKRLNEGGKVWEVGAVSTDQFNTIPKQHFEEMRRLAKLNNVKLTMHAPVQGVEPSGLNPQGGGWSENARQAIENQLKTVVDRSLELMEKGPQSKITPITIHSTNMPGTEFVPYVDPVTGERGKKVDLYMGIDQDTYKIMPIQEEKQFKLDMSEEDRKKYPEGRIFSPEERLKEANEKNWDSSIKSIIYRQAEALRIFDREEEHRAELKKLDTTLNKINSNPTQALESLRQETENPNLNESDLSQIKNQYEEKKKMFSTSIDSESNIAKTYVDDIRRETEMLVNRALKFGDNSSKEKVNGLLNNYQQEMAPLNNLGGDDRVRLAKEAEAIGKLLKNLNDDKNKITPPSSIIPIEQFATEKSSETFANVALHAYKEADRLGKDSPVISIENLDMARFGFSQSEDMNKLVDASRVKLAEKLVKEGLSNKEAKKKAEDIIGMTFDVGHMNISKKKGFIDADLIEEAKKIAKNVKHVHLTDNFGYGDSHLAPGMGNVPIKALMEAIEKRDGGFQGLKVVEAGGMIGEFKESPTMYALRGLGASLYIGSSGQGRWSTSYGLHEGYFGGYGNMLPQTNYQMFGAGFSQLPQELGGSMPGQGRSRMGGNSLE